MAGHWFWLSFADKHKWLGGCYVDADLLIRSGVQAPKTPDPKDQRFADAVMVAHILGINPGGEVRGAPVEGDLIPPHHPREIFIPAAQARALDMVRWSEPHDPL